MLRYLTAGESHGRALVVIVEGLPAGLPLAVEEVQGELARRRLGYGRGPRMRFEQDEVTIIGGVRHGRTLGSPVAIEVANSEWERDPDKWQRRCRCGPRTGPPRRPSPRSDPGTPTWPACRSTASPMPATSSSGPPPARPRRASRPARWPRPCSAELDVEVLSHVIQMGGGPLQGHRPAPAERPRTRSTSRPCAASTPPPRRPWSRRSRRRPRTATASAASSRCSPTACRWASGSHVHWDRKLDALLARALMSIQAVKGVEIGDGFEVAGRRGSDAHDPISWDAEAGTYRRESALAGGVEGGISTGELLVARAAMKPLATLNRPTLKTVDTATKEETV